MSSKVLLPRTMEIGAGALQKLPSLLRDGGYQRPFLIADAIMLELGVVQQVADTLTANGIDFDVSLDVFTEVMPEPTETSLLPAVECAKQRQFDCIVALGGGSAIDSAKAVGLLAKAGGSMRDYKVPVEVKTVGLPVIAIPTTAGTGSEVTRFTIITDTASDEKMLCMGDGLMPVAAIIDYELTLSLPARVTADTGIDALTHAIEAYVSRKANAYSDQQALAALRLLAPNLRKVYSEPKNTAAREAMMLGATLAGIAFSNASIALVHGMSRPLGVHFHIPHGLSNAMILPLVTKFSMGSALPRYADCARAMKVASDGDSDTLATQKLMSELLALNHDLKVPTLAEFGVKHSEYETLIELMVEQAIASGSPANNPKVPSKQELARLYSQAYTPQ